MSARNIYCPSCRRAHPWSSATVGHVVECPCGRALSIPPSPQDVPPSDETYDLQEVPRPKRPVSAPVEIEDETPVPTARPAAAKPVLRYQPQEVEESENWREAIKGSEFKHLILPISFAVLALVIRFGMVFVGSTSGTGHVLASFGIALATMVMSTITLFIAVAVVAKFTGADLGPLPLTIIKLTACGMLGSVIMGVGAYFEMQGIGAGLIAVQLSVLLYWVLFSIFFEMDLQENLMAVAIAGLLQSGVICMLWSPAAPQ